MLPTLRMPINPSANLPVLYTAIQDRLASVSLAVTSFKKFRRKPNRDTLHVRFGYVTAMTVEDSLREFAT